MVVSKVIYGYNFIVPLITFVQSIINFLILFLPYREFLQNNIDNKFLCLHVGRIFEIKTTDQPPAAKVIVQDELF